MLEGVHILLFEYPLMRRDIFRLSVCKVSGANERRNNGRKDSSDYREGLRIIMKNGMEGKFISSSKHGDGLLYCRGNGCG